MDDIRQIKVDLEDVRQRLRPHAFVQEPTALVGKISGTPPTSVPAWFRVQPMKISGKPIEGQDYDLTQLGSEILACVIGPSVPVKDDIVVARMVDGKWVVETCCGSDPCHYPATPNKIPQTDLTLSWSGPDGSGSVILKTSLSSNWKSDLFSFGGFYYQATLIVYANNITQLWIAKYSYPFTGGYITTYFLSGATTISGHPYGVRFTSSSGSPFESTWDVISDIDGPCCALIGTIGCNFAVSTEVTVYDKDDNILASGTSDSTGRLPLMWTGKATKFKANSTNPLFADRIITYPDGFPCNKGVLLQLLPADPSSYVCCKCNIPIPRRLYLTTPDGTFASDYTGPYPGPPPDDICHYTSVCYMKNLSPGVVMAKLGLYSCETRNIGDPVDTKVILNPKIVSIGNDIYIYVDVSVYTYAQTCVTGFTAELKGPFYYAAVQDCNSYPECFQECGPLFGGKLQNPFQANYGGRTKLVGCNPAVTVNCVPVTDGTYSLGPPIASVVVSL